MVQRWHPRTKIVDFSVLYTAIALPDWMGWKRCGNQYLKVRYWVIKGGIIALNEVSKLDTEKVTIYQIKSKIL